MFENPFPASHSVLIVLVVSLFCGSTLYGNQTGASNDSMALTRQGSSYAVTLNGRACVQFSPPELKGSGAQ